MFYERFPGKHCFKFLGCRTFWGAYCTLVRQCDSWTPLTTWDPSSSIVNQLWSNTASTQNLPVLSEEVDIEGVLEEFHCKPPPPELMVPVLFHWRAPPPPPPWGPSQLTVAGFGCSGSILNRSENAEYLSLPVVVGPAAAGAEALGGADVKSVKLTPPGGGCEPGVEDCGWRKPTREILMK